MARTTSKAEAPAAQYDPEAEYRVRLTRTVVLPNGVRLLPRDAEIKLRGRVIAELGDAVESAEKV